MADLASVDDLQKLMKRTFSGDDLEQANTVLAQVSSWARSQSGQAWTDPAAVPTDVMYVVLSASRRTLTNPNGVITKTKGPFSVTYDKPPADFFTKGELQILNRFRNTSRGGLFTTGFTRGERETRMSRPGLMWFGEEELGEPFPVYWDGFAEESLSLDDL